LFPHSAVRDLWWLAIAGSGVVARYAQMRSRSRVNSFFDPETVATRLLNAQSNHGYNAHSLVSIAPGARIWQCPQVDGAIIFNEFGKVWLVPGDPLADPRDLSELTRRFIRAAHEAKRLVAFMPTTERFAMHSAELGLHAVKVGAAPYFDLTTWGPRGDRAKKARAGVNQARRAGVRIAAVAGIDRTLKRETAFLCDRWLKSRRCAMKLGWLFALDPFQHADRKRFFTARDARGNLVGFLAASPIPARAGWYLEDVIRLPDAPVGTADLLVVEALNSLKASGAKLATLGTAPLASEGEVAPGVGNSEPLTRFIRMAAGGLSVFYNFEGLRRFKMKFAPSWWESEYLLFPVGVKAPAHVIRAFIRAICPDGASKLLAQQIARGMRLGRSKHDLFRENDGPLRTRTSSMDHDNLVRDSDLRAVEPRSDLIHRGAHKYLGQFVSVAGMRLHYISKGQGQAVVFIHGNPGSHHDFSVTALGELAQHYRAMVLDRPGHGYSERRLDEPLTVEVQARLVREALHRLNVHKPLVVGHSWGGALALAMALQNEEDLSGLVLLAPAAYPSGGPQWWASLPNLPVLGKVFLKLLKPLIGRRLIRSSLRDAYHPEPVQDDYLQQAEALWIRTEQVKACAADDCSLDESLNNLSRRYAEIRLPVVIVTGDADRLLRPAEQAERLHRVLHNSELISLPRTGHQVPLTHPESVHEAIKRAWELIAEDSSRN